MDAKYLADQRAVAERVGHSHQPGGDLKVKEVARRLSGPEPAEPHLLAAGVDDDDAAGVHDKVPEGVERPRRKRVDEKEPIRCGRLNETQARVIGVFADELGVEAEMRMGGERWAQQSGEFFGRGNDLFRQIGHNPSSKKERLSAALPLK